MKCPKPLIVLLVYLLCGIPYVWREPIVWMIWTASVLSWIVMKLAEIHDRLKRLERAVNRLPAAGEP